MTPAEVGWLGLGPIHQLGIVTEDLDRSIRRRGGAVPDALWKGWTYGPGFLGWQRIGSTAAEFEMRLAVSGSNPQVELVQPIAGDTSLSAALGAARAAAVSAAPDVVEVLHHLGLFVTDFAAEHDRLADRGIRCLESGGGHGLDGDGSFGYFDTRELLGVLVELIQPPRRRPEPQFVVRGAESPAGCTSSAARE